MSMSSGARSNEVVPKFEGFPASYQGTVIPNVFFSAVLPQVVDAGELIVSLFLFRECYAKKGRPQYVRFSELAALESLKQALGAADLGAALELVVARGTFISLALKGSDGADAIYLLNTVANHREMQRIANRETLIPGAEPMPEETSAAPAPNVFSLYENNIGELTPMVAEQLKLAAAEYPADWIGDAIREAADLNKRNWRYIQRILENWQTEGRGRGKSGRRIQERDPDRFTKGKYGHIVRR
jgi:DNA replication protein